MRRTGVAAALLLATAAVSACGSESEDPNDPGDYADAREDAADCADVWVTGRTLPGDYSGCIDADNEYVPAVAATCDSGAADLVTFEENETLLYTDADGAVVEAASGSTDPDYQARTTDCP